MAEIYELERDECLQLLARGSFGRLAIDTGRDTPAIRPVNYLFDGPSQSVVIRTARGSKLHWLLRARTAAFEIDGVDPAQRTGWSVIVAGRADEIAHPSELRRLEQAGLDSWAPDPKPLWFRIRATRVSGRRITLDP
jgi:nitroimidazol reductase NimA-like FMN-containing flavoprotein (pyridoxamine 5'-phosphate oxidase superfamily)